MEQKVKRIIEDKLGLDSKSYELDSDFKYDLGCDSLDMVEVIMECEREFNLEIPDSDVEKLNTVQDLINYVKEHAK